MSIELPPVTPEGARVAGKVALVTGAARGQGRSHAVRLAAEGADVILLDVCAPVETVPYALATSDDLAETARQVEALDRRAWTAEVDVRDLDGLHRAVEAGVEALGGGLDLVCANAGIVHSAPADELTEQEWSVMVDVNLGGTWRTCRVAIPHLRARGGGAMVLTSSVAGLKGVANLAHYSAAKHGVVGLMRTLAQELAADRIRVNCVNPTQVGTDMILNDFMYGLFRPDLEHPTRADFAQTSRSTHLLDVDWVESADVSNAVLFLLSDEARYITGVALPVDAGNLAR
jgi:(+)-trans-carveol dehydrogenase